MEKEHKKVTKASIAKDTEELNAITAEFSDSRTSEERKIEIQPEIQRIDQKIKYDQHWLDTGSKLGTMNANKGERVIGAGKGFEITVKS